MSFKLARLAPLVVLAVTVFGASSASAHPHAARCCCRPHVVRHHLTHVRTIVREKVIIDHIVEGPSEWRPAPEAPPQELQVSDLWLSGGVGPAYIGGGGGGGFAYAQGSGTANAGASASAMASAQASISASIAIHGGFDGRGWHGGHGCGCGKGGH
jgi:hypothetical protein